MGFMRVHNEIWPSTHNRYVIHRPLFQPNPAQSEPCRGDLAPKAGKRGDTEDIISEVPVQTKAEPIVRSEALTENEHWPVPKACSDDDLITGAKNNIRLGAVSNTGQVEANDGFTILPNNTA